MRDMVLDPEDIDLRSWARLDGLGDSCHGSDAPLPTGAFRETLKDLKRVVSVREAAGGTFVPLYEYQCAGCDNRFEVLQRVGQGPEGLECPDCGGADIEKEYSTFAGCVSGSSSAGAGACAPGRFT